MSESKPQNKFWLLKAEPDSRIVKGKEVKFSVDDFERVKTSPWEGVRNYEARNLMKEMKVGQEALFYHSNCKNPGVAAFAQVAKEAYPDYTAWDSCHPYYDPKSDSINPRWYMIDLTFSSRAKHFIPLALFRFIANYSSLADLPEELAYIGAEGLKAIKRMDLVTRGRLSVQRVEEDAWKAIVLLAEKGGWQELDLNAPSKKSAKGAKKRGRGIDGEDEAEKIFHARSETKLASESQAAKKRKREDEKPGMASEDVDANWTPRQGRGTKRKRKIEKDDEDVDTTPWRTTRARK